MLTTAKVIGRELWRDECGAVVSAETVMVASLGVAGASVGFDTVSQAVNEELTDVALAIRSLDQSYAVRGRKSAGSWTAPSRFQQTDAQTARQEILEYKSAAKLRQTKGIESAREDDSLVRQ